ncbi:hypothetical protein PI124_g14991 [Phytophthora idaei]|nr:hypothetical protein PI126_g13926 [Phytophthora idaei]KAG3240092.1 hypothetical protein PI124_g14991 [Phytophthora idaei]
MDFVFGLPPDSKRRTGVVVFVDRFSKMVHLAAAPAEVTAVQAARLFVDMVFVHHGMPLDIVSDRDPRFTARFWQEVFTLLGTQLSMSTADHPQMDGQTERVNRVLGNLLKSYAHSFQHWSNCLPMPAFVINKSLHAWTGHIPFYVNAMRHPRLTSMLGTVASSLSGRTYGCIRTTAEERCYRHSISDDDTKTSRVSFPERDDEQELRVCAGHRQRTGRACCGEERRAEQTIQHASNGLCPAPTSRTTVCPGRDSSFCG